MMIMISQPTLPELEIDQYTKQMMCSFVVLNRCGHWDVYTCVRRCSLSWVYARQAWPARLHSARRIIALCLIVSLSVCYEFLFCVWLTLTMLRFCGYKLRSYWFYICAFVENTFAVRGSFLRFHSMARQLCGAGARARLPTIYFFLPHFGAIKVRRHSLACQMSSGFCVPHLLKLVYFSILLKIRKRIYIAFL